MATRLQHKTTGVVVVTGRDVSLFSDAWEVQKPGSADAKSTGRKSTATKRTANKSKPAEKPESKETDTPESNDAEKSESNDAE